jgi:hypothetical protein
MVENGGLLKKRESKDQLPSPLGYGVIFEMDSLIIPPWSYLQISSPLINYFIMQNFD